VPGEAEPRKHAFPPVVAADTRVLILGSLPGDASLAAGQYYAHPRNLFWPLMADLTGLPALPELPYPDRLAALRAAGIGLWDTIASATRKGSLDTAIRDAEGAPLAQLVATLPALGAVAFNGKASARLGRAQLSGTSVALIDLPSSSPAHAALSFPAKREKWRQLLPFLANRG
jgi:hypoxanthine-DNA glycosylase